MVGIGCFLLFLKFFVFFLLFRKFVSFLVEANSRFAAFAARLVCSELLVIPSFCLSAFA